MMERADQSSRRATADSLGPRRRNLLWAATSFVQPAAAVAIRAMPVLGAAVGSETVQQIAQDAPRKERERWLEDRVLEQFDEVYTHVKGSIERMRRNFEPAFVSITAPGPQDVWWGEAVPEIPK